MSQQVKVIDDGGVRWIELDRPESKNGLTHEVNRRMIEAIESAQDDDAVRCLVITGSHGSFCSGADLKELAKLGPQPTDVMSENMRAYFHGLIRAVRASTRPTIAAVDGAAVGFGADLALACDLRLLSERARFGEIFVKRGLMPDGGSTWLLPRLVGVGVALDLMLSGRFVDADEAMRIGLGTRVIPHEDFHESVWNHARSIAAGPPLVHQAIKRSVALALESSFDAALDNERETQVQLLKSDDFAEGLAAFLGKREPSFRGR